LRRALLISAAALALVLASPPAAAEDPATAQAQSLFAEGRTALEKGDYATACAKFHQSLAVVKRASTLLNLGQCEQELGKLVSSAEHWRAGIAALPAGDERIAPSKERAAAVEARIPHLTVKLSAPGPAGTRVEVDGAAAPADALGAGIPVDPGRHTVVLLVPGAADQRSTLDIGEKESRTVSFSIDAAAAPKIDAPAPAPASKGSGMRTAGFALLGVGAAGVIVAAATGAVLVGKHSSIDTDCPNQVCNPAGRSLINGLGPLNAVNAVGWGLAIAGVAAGIPLVVIGGKGQAQATVGTAPLPGGGGLWMTARF